MSRHRVATVLIVAGWLLLLGCLTLTWWWGRPPGTIVIETPIHVDDIHELAPAPAGPWLPLDPTIIYIETPHRPLPEIQGVVVLG